jgi:hypothetical protein
MLLRSSSLGQRMPCPGVPGVLYTLGIFTNSPNFFSRFLIRWGYPNHALLFSLSKRMLQDK